ncbi:MAG: Gfo/Idh/MocA family oxidoreductase [Candidatus Sumerlaeota bacterium]|nr:Gfo/Idh/MocA family oxidoreductase [Candidatus Sumerlaeota bacterium]
MSKLRIGIIGTGKKQKASRFGYAMAYQHANAYKLIPECEIAACADIVEENARAFAGAYGAKMIFTDYRKMLAEAKPDMVSICTWMHLHERMALDAIDAGVKAIHCEKPMADTWAGAKRMAAAAKAKGVQLTFNHQRRYGAPFAMAKKMLDDGAIGTLQRLECGAGNLYDTGTHFVDMFSFFNHETPGKWVLAQIDYRQENFVFGSHNENQNVALIEYANGVFGLVMMGAPGGENPVGCVDKLIGTDGVIEIGVANKGPALRYRRAGDKEWTAADTKGESIHGPGFIERALADVVVCLREGRKCQLDASNALIVTEIIFGAYESSRRRGRVDFPLNIEDNPLAAMVESGALKPAPDLEGRARK